MNDHKECEFIGLAWQDEGGCFYLNLHDAGPSLVYGANAIELTDMLDGFERRRVRVFIETIDDDEREPLTDGTGCDV